MPIKGLRIGDVVATAQVGMEAFKTKTMELHNVQIGAKTRPVFLIRDFTDLEHGKIRTRRPLNDHSVVRLDHCPGAIVRAKPRPRPGLARFDAHGAYQPSRRASPASRNAFGPPLPPERRCCRDSSSVEH